MNHRGGSISLEDNGNLEIVRDNSLLTRGTSRPKSTKTLSNGQSYTSEAFTGSGERFSGYNFQTSSKYFRISANRAGFKIYISQTGSNPGNYYLVYALWEEN